LSRPTAATREVRHEQRYGDEEPQCKRGDHREPPGELGLPLEELVRRGARDILQRAIEAEVEQLLEEFAGVSLMDGRRAVVRRKGARLEWH
jgi:hypothetical protein